MSQIGKNKLSKAADAIMAFTLIELLVVISIIGVLAALIIPLSGVATTKMRIARTKAELNQIVSAIEGYKLETGSYPPDNGNLRSAITLIAYKTNAAMNPLFYELTGAVFTNNPTPTFRTLAEGETIKPADLQTYFGVSGIQNSARSKHDIDYKGFSAKPAQYAELLTGPGTSGPDVEILSVAAPGPYELPGRKGKKINPYFYDSSTTNRHNKAGFDLWAEILIGSKQTNIIANWKN